MAGKKEKKGEAPPEGADGAEGEEGTGGKKKLAGKQLILFIVLPAILLLGGGGAAAYFLVFAKKPAAVADAKGEKGKEDEKKKKDEKKKEKGKDEKGGDKKDGEGGIKLAEGPNGEGFVTLPDLIVNITTADSRPAYLKLRLTLQAKDMETAETIEPLLPRILDQYTGFLRELRMEDIAGSAGYSRLQLELLKRVNLAIAPAQVDAVLIEEMLVQ
ncbi:flagellar basal body-associated FliL family protein [Aquidulcibacter sp.]|uniref:flagellar basal body-associated FliL family protein n=1 Tax=Aquidulcibacter sp. TaxID=2052990 RepID=UPI0025B92AE5|nr:flagellar basal body-associated FliL family protein [Aquidulcibacter sp.]MCA3697649.1 flagellar basal body-associated FliL family protein [Aquidulcibacter sp.]